MNPLNYQIDPYESQIVEGCLNNDRSAQRGLYDRYKDAMYTIVFRIMNDEDDACDALQEGFIQVFKNIAGYRFNASLGAWIKTIMIRTALKKQRKVVTFSPIEDIKNIEESILEWDQNLTGEYLDKAIKQLPDGYRNVFLLIEVEGYSHKEVGEMLGISTGTSKSQLFHSKKMLQQLLKDIM